MVVRPGHPRSEYTVMLAKMEERCSGRILGRGYMRTGFLNASTDRFRKHRAWTRDALPPERAAGESNTAWVSNLDATHPITYVKEKPSDMVRLELTSPGWLVDGKVAWSPVSPSACWHEVAGLLCTADPPRSCSTSYRHSWPKGWGDHRRSSDDMG